MSLTSIKSRNITPNWRSPDATIINGEMDGLYKSPIQKQDVNIQEYIYNWQQHKTLPYAGELLSVAFTNGIKIEGEISEAHDFLKNRDLNPKSVHTVISGILNKKCDESPSRNRDFTEESWKDSIIKEISVARKLVRESPFNALRRIELARAFLRMGLNDKAAVEAKTAIQLMPDNRYLTRCAVRCFLHLNDPDTASYILHKNPFLKNDPWLLSAEVVIDTVRNKTPNDLKIARYFLEGKNISPVSLTELAMAVATFERVNGCKVKVLKRLVSIGLQAPNDNSLAQAEWLSQQERNIVLPSIPSDEIPFNYEAETLRYNDSCHYEEAYEMSLKWMETSNFSRRAASMASSIAAVNLGKREDAINLLKIGLISNPDNEILLNNLSYHLLLDMKTDAAFKRLSKIDIASLDFQSRMCVQATWGLYYFRKGLYDEGLRRYNDVIAETNKRGDYEMSRIALMNLLREQAIAGMIPLTTAYTILEEMKLSSQEELSLRTFIYNDLKPD